MSNEVIIELQMLCIFFFTNAFIAYREERGMLLFAIGNGEWIWNKSLYGFVSKIAYGKVCKLLGNRYVDTYLRMAGVWEGKGLTYRDKGVWLWI